MRIQCASMPPCERALTYNQMIVFMLLVYVAHIVCIVLGVHTWLPRWSVVLCATVRTCSSSIDILCV